MIGQSELSEVRRALQSAHSAILTLKDREPEVMEIYNDYLPNPENRKLHDAAAHIALALSILG
jgi:hypothetical protein